ncbi:hypothetical protein TSUD_348810 [Trifolium subterraneum]|uniref:Uncharacterized protein n=1 Tax=Trifolium subterraneum TaxID=3900 RepID=A0A2Z6N851_TRISU|nr:hypothetical protein TSUD_348810 [Trifolium subterraneum]
MVTEELIVVVTEAAGGGCLWFIKRLFAPLCICVAQYFLPGRTALLHRHFLPSVPRHLPVSDAIMLLKVVILGATSVARMEQGVTTEASEPMTFLDRSEADDVFTIQKLLDGVYENESLC